MNLPTCFDIPDRTRGSLRCQTMPYWSFDHRIVHYSNSKLNATRNGQTDERVRKSRRRLDQAKSSLVVVVSSFSPPVTVVYQTRSLFWTHLSSWSTKRSSSISSQALTATRLVRVSRQLDDPFERTH